MKNISKLFVLGCCASSSLLFTGCIDEVLPTSGATQEQIDKSVKAKESLLWGMPMFTNQFNVLGYPTNEEQAYDWGYGSIMHIRDVMTEEYAVASSNYDWYTSWAQNKYLGPQYAATGFIWYYYYGFIQTANKMIEAINENNATETELGYLGAGYAFRALAYLDLAQMYEFLPNDKISGVNSDNNDVTGLTVPIVTEKTTEEESRKNPRVDRETMYNFILNDLNKAESNIVYLSRSAKVLPDLTAVYGLKARLYMWVGDYDNAKTYARKAIDLDKYAPTTKDEWLSITSGFNDPSVDSWIWSSQAVKENSVVQTGIINWTSWVSNETSYGYASAGPITLVGKGFYDKISNSDFRKLSWKAPEGSRLASQNTFVSPSIGENLPEYAGLKFRPGQGNPNDYKVGSAVGFPLMRIEEMYFIEAEAVAHNNPADGKALIEKFMRENRDKAYTCRATDAEGVVDEIFFQKRVEFWGEGISYFDYKRLNKSVTRLYEGSNFSDLAQFNTDGRPAWMNFVIIRSELSNNTALKGWNNPDPSGCY